MENAENTSSSIGVPIFFGTIGITIGSDRGGCCVPGICEWEAREFAIDREELARRNGCLDAGQKLLVIPLRDLHSYYYWSCIREVWCSSLMLCEQASATDAKAEGEERCESKRERQANEWFLFIRSLLRFLDECHLHSFIVVNVQMFLTLYSCKIFCTICNFFSHFEFIDGVNFIGFQMRKIINLGKLPFKDTSKSSPISSIFPFPKSQYLFMSSLTSSLSFFYNYTTL